MKIRVRVGPSRIAGQGLFARQEIKQDTKIIRYIGERITHEASERRLAAGNAYIFGLDERYALDGSTPKNTHPISIIRVTQTATPNSSGASSGL